METCENSGGDEVSDDLQCLGFPVNAEEFLSVVCVCVHVQRLSTT